MNRTKVTERPIVLLLIASLTTAATVLVALVGNDAAQLATLAVVCLALFVYIAVVHPRVPLVAFGAVLGVAPYIHLQCTELPWCYRSWPPE